MWQLPLQFASLLGPSPKAIVQSVASSARCYTQEYEEMWRRPLQFASPSGPSLATIVQSVSSSARCYTQEVEEMWQLPLQFASLSGPSLATIVQSVSSSARCYTQEFEDVWQLPLQVASLSGPSPASHCTVGCKFCSMLHPRILGNVATAFAICLFVMPRFDIHPIFGFNVLSIDIPQGKPFIKADTWDPNPSATRKFDTSSLVLPAPTTTAECASCCTLDESLMQCLFVSMVNRFATLGCRNLRRPEVLTSSKRSSKTFESVFEPPWRQVSILIQRTFPSSGLLVVWLMRITQDPGGAYCNNAAFFFISFSIPSFPSCRQYPSYSTNNAAFSSLRTPHKLRSGSR